MKAVDAGSGKLIATTDWHSISPATQGLAGSVVSGLDGSPGAILRGQGGMLCGPAESVMDQMLATVNRERTRLPIRRWKILIITAIYYVTINLNLMLKDTGLTIRMPATVREALEIAAETDLRPAGAYVLRLLVEDLVKRKLIKREQGHLALVRAPRSDKGKTRGRRRGNPKESRDSRRGGVR
ncbi:MAG: hypothetical protein V2A73_02240 [Pseudomonadota bacterium]